MGDFIGLGISISMLLLAFISGKIVEKRRLNYLDGKEKDLLV